MIHDVSYCFFCFLVYLVPLFDGNTAKFKEDGYKIQHPSNVKTFIAPPSSTFKKEREIKLSLERHFNVTYWWFSQKQ